MSNVIPTIVELDFHPVVLNVGELFVLDALLKLDDEWDVYVQPLIGQHRPDFVASHPAHGVCVIEVKDWQPGSVRETERGAIEASNRGRWVHTSDSPYLDAALTRKAVVEQFFNGDDTDPTAVRAIVVLAQFTTAQACALLRRAPSIDARHWISVWGGAALTNDLECVISGHPRPVQHNISPTSLANLRRHCEGQAARQTTQFA